MKIKEHMTHAQMSQKGPYTLCGGDEKKKKDEEPLLWRSRKTMGDASAVINIAGSHVTGSQRFLVCSSVWCTWGLTSGFAEGFYSRDVSIAWTAAIGLMPFLHKRRRRFPLVTEQMQPRWNWDNKLHIGMLLWRCSKQTDAVCDGQITICLPDDQRYLAWHGFLFSL